MTGDTIVMTANEDAKIKLKAMSRQYSTPIKSYFTDKDGKEIIVEDSENFLNDESRLASLDLFERDFIAQTDKTLAFKMAKLRARELKVIERREEWERLTDEQKAGILKKNPSYMKKLESVTQNDRSIKFLIDLKHAVQNTSVSTRIGKQPLIEALVKPHAVHESIERAVPLQEEKKSFSMGGVLR